jgi:HJR/Mrr/RecB family endonuclease
LSEYICEQKGYSFDIGLFVITTYLLTNFYFVEQASEEWNNRHGFYFSDIHELNIDEVVDIFVSIENINYQRTENIGFFIHFLIKNNLLHEYDNNYLKSFEVLYPKINESLIKKKNNRFIENLKRTESAGSRKYTISDIDLMTGLEFEMFISELFGIMGYISEITKASGDQGIDVIAEKNGVTIGIQAKCYSSAVGNKAVQEAVAGKNHYKLDKVIVITNNTFTESAQKLALSNAVLLWDRSILKEKIEDFF